MQLGIIGLPKSGKTTVFNALTRGRVETTRAHGPGKPNLGVAKVPDPRLEALAAMFKPERVVAAEVRYVDIPGDPEGMSKTHGIGGESLNTLQQTDALLMVVRSFQDPSVPHQEGSVDPYRDAATMQLELAYSDLAILERRAERLQAEMKGAKAADRDRIQRESALITRLKSGLEEEVSIRGQELLPEERRSISDYQFLTAKPLLVLFNIGEEELPNLDAMERETAARLGRMSQGTAVMCGRLEMELGEMDEADEQEFRASLGAGEAGGARMIRISYDLLGLVSFFTTGSDEVRAWTIEIETPAAQAARRIHSDMERGFIRAEVVSYDDLMRLGSISDSRQHGVLRAEGRTYPVQDGDVITFLFHV